MSRLSTKQRRAARRRRAGYAQEEHAREWFRMFRAAQDLVRAVVLRRLGRAS